MEDPVLAKPYAYLAISGLRGRSEHAASSPSVSTFGPWRQIDGLRCSVSRQSGSRRRLQAPRRSPTRSAADARRTLAPRRTKLLHRYEAPVTQMSGCEVGSELRGPPLGCFLATIVFGGRTGTPSHDGRRAVLCCCARQEADIHG